MSVTKDILAAITFLATGLLFFVAQAGDSSDGVFTSAVDCEVVEAVVVQEHAPEGPVDLNLDPPVIRDS